MGMSLDNQEERQQRQFSELEKLGAGDFAHLNGSLKEHLMGTRDLLLEFEASEKLASAGLFHAAYGTAGFESNMVGLEQRHRIAKIIGEQAEAIVYTYCACDRAFTFKHFDDQTDFKFRNRFTGSEEALSVEGANDFCLLTVANELELAIDSADFKAQHGQGLYELFKRMYPFLNAKAIGKVEWVLGN